MFTTSKGSRAVKGMLDLSAVWPNSPTLGGSLLDSSEKSRGSLVTGQNFLTCPPPLPPIFMVKGGRMTSVFAEVAVLWGLIGSDPSEIRPQSVRESRALDSQTLSEVLLEITRLAQALVVAQEVSSYPVITKWLGTLPGWSSPSWGWKSVIKRARGSCEATQASGTQCHIFPPWLKILDPSIWGNP
jgi:hypothetical protein